MVRHRLQLPHRRRRQCVRRQGVGQGIHPNSSSDLQPIGVFVAKLAEDLRSVDFTVIPSRLSNFILFYQAGRTHQGLQRLEHRRRLPRHLQQRLGASAAGGRLPAPAEGGCFQGVHRQGLQAAGGEAAEADREPRKGTVPADETVAALVQDPGDLRFAEAEVEVELKMGV